MISLISNKHTIGQYATMYYGGHYLKILVKPPVLSIKDQYGKEISGDLFNLPEMKPFIAAGEVGWEFGCIAEWYDHRLQVFQMHDHNGDPSDISMELASTSCKDYGLPMLPFVNNSAALAIIEFGTFSNLRGLVFRDNNTNIRNLYKI